MGTVRFILREDKPDKKGFCPIELVYQISGQRRYYRPKEKISSDNWNPVTQKALYIDRKTAKRVNPLIDLNLLPSSKDIDDINNNLTGLKKEIADIEDRFKLNGIIYSPDMVIAALKESISPETKRSAPTNELFVFIDKYIEDHKTTREPGSLSVYKALKTHLEKFQTEKNIKVTFESINYAFFQQFQNFLIDKRKLNNTTVAKQLGTVKTFLNYAKLQGIKVPDGFRDFKIKRETLEVIALTESEFQTLYHLNLKGNKKLDQVRDVFCFSCVTGLRYSDLSALKWENIKPDEIRIIVKKTKQPLTIPLTPYSHAILKKYNGNQYPLPVISNQKMNDYLKELCKLAEIDEQIEIVRFRGTKRESNTYAKHELISVHTGRKTFATLSLEKGMSAEEVMNTTGHLDYKSFKRYVKVTEARKKVVMGKAWKMTKVSKLKAV
jgi:integrase